MLFLIRIKYFIVFNLDFVRVKAAMIQILNLDCVLSVVDGSQYTVGAFCDLQYTRRSIVLFFLSWLQSSGSLGLGEQPCRG